MQTISFGRVSNVISFTDDFTYPSNTICCLRSIVMVMVFSLWLLLLTLLEHLKPPAYCISCAQKYESQPSSKVQLTEKVNVTTINHVKPDIEKGIQ